MPKTLIPLTERLRASEFDDNSTRAPYQRLRNPDGPEAADRIEQLEAENESLRREVNALKVGTGPDKAPS